MKTLYLECAMGAAGDMLTASLLELLDDQNAFLEKMNGLGLPGVHVSASPAKSCGITGTHVTVTVHGQTEDGPSCERPYPPYEYPHSPHEYPQHPHEYPHEHGHEHGHAHGHEHAHGHTGLHEVEHLLSHLDLPQPVRQDALAVFRLIAQAEGHVHGCDMEQIHFHEVGTMDAVADVVAVCWLMHLIAPERVVASPVHVGSGTVRCAHGVLPVPAPATAYLLQGIPTYGGSVAGELCTPTGAALLKHFVQAFGDMPAMAAQRIGYGMGSKEFPRANCLRSFLGETAEQGDQVLELRCNVDDMTGEAMGFALEQLMASGALDAWVTPITMKKGRPAFLLSCLCRPEDRGAMTALLFRHTTTLGVRENLCARQVLKRREVQQPTPYGPVSVKESSGCGVTRRKMACDDRIRLMREHGLTWQETEELLR